MSIESVGEMVARGRRKIEEIPSGETARAWQDLQMSPLATAAKAILALAQERLSTVDDLAQKAKSGYEGGTIGGAIFRTALSESDNPDAQGMDHGAEYIAKCASSQRLAADAIQRHLREIIGLAGRMAELVTACSQEADKGIENASNISEAQAVVIGHADAYLAQLASPER